LQLFYQTTNFIINMGPSLYILFILSVATYILWLWYLKSSNDMELKVAIRTSAFNWFSLSHSFLYQFIDI
jgi:magnesium-transporting ATPase (P-type)